MVSLGQISRMKRNGNRDLRSPDWAVSHPRSQLHFPYGWEVTIIRVKGRTLVSWHEDRPWDQESAP